MCKNNKIIIWRLEPNFVLKLSLLKVKEVNAKKIDLTRNLLVKDSD